MGENIDLSPSTGFHKLDGPSGFAFSIFLSINFTDHRDRWVRYPFEPGYLTYILQTFFFSLETDWLLF